MSTSKEPEIKQVILIGGFFKTDITALDLELLIQPKKWAEIANSEAYHLADDEVIEWMKIFTPTLYRIATETSNRKAHDRHLINVVKAKLLFEQLDLVGLRPLQLGRFMGLSLPVFENSYNYLKKAYKKHDVQGEYRVYQSTVGYENISYRSLCCQYGYSDYYEKRIKVLHDKQPDSEYLTLAKKIMDEFKQLDIMRRSIDEVDFDPNRDKSDYHTCSVCFRWIRLQPSNRDLIAYHGHTISRYSYNDVVGQSCNGANFKPFQISADGTIAAIKEHKNQLAQYEKELVRLAELGEKEKGTVQYQLISNLISGCKNYIDFAKGKLKAKYPERLPEVE